MKTEPNGATGAENEVAAGGLEERLASRFAVSLAQAERDYPTLAARTNRSGVGAGEGAGEGAGKAGGRGHAGRSGGLWPRLAAPVATLAALALVAVIGVGLAYRPAAPAGPGSPSASPSIGRDIDGVPTEIGGQRVYRAADQAEFGAISGSFLLGGRVTTPDVFPPCPAPVDRTDAEAKLIWYCTWVAIDGLRLAPQMLPTVYSPGSELVEFKNHIVVARVHVNDALAANCPATILAQCKASIVAEAIVWQDAAAPSVSPTVEPLASPSGVAEPSMSSGVYVPSGSPAVIAMGPDGTPVSIGDRTVYRAATLPADKLFLLGGVLRRDGSCTAPSTLSVKPPACGYWSIDGIAVGTMSPLTQDLEGIFVVAEVETLSTTAVCPNGPCRNSDNLVVRWIVWAASGTHVSPPPPASIAP